MLSQLQRYLYPVCQVIITVFLLAIWLIRSIKDRDYLIRIYQSLGYYSTKNRLDRSIWLHAVSVGENICAQPLVDALVKKYPQVPLCITTTTTNGYRYALKHYGKVATVCFAPIDLPQCVKALIRHINPQVAIIIETELWPGWLTALKAEQIPCLLANARLSERSCRGYQRIDRHWASQWLVALSAVLAQTQLEADRFIQLGVKPAVVKVTGQLKLAIPAPTHAKAEGQKLRSQWDRDWVVLAASTHDGEEAIVLDAFKQLTSQRQTCGLILVPRHPERSDELARLCHRQGLTATRYSQWHQTPFSSQVLIVDQIGLLWSMYGLADRAFVGGSLIQRGGHNPIEPAKMGCAFCTGPHTFNFMALYQELIDIRGCQLVNNSQQLFEFWHASDLADQVQQASQFVQSKTDVLDQHMQVISEWLEKK
jgi:3-deoxy-D-manno-octulosonic-acid transferase